MKSKKFIPFLFILILLLFNTLPAHAAQNKTQSSKKAYQQFLYKNREKNKYFQIVNIGNKNTPVLIIGTGKKEAVNGKTYFNNCKVYTFSDNHIKQMEPFQNYGGRFISLKKKKGKYYLCNGGSDFSSLYTIKNGKAITHEYFNCHSAKGTDRTNQSVLKKDKKIIKNLGYLNAEKYRKYRDSYKIVKSSIIFKQNTHSNRKSILKSNK